MWDWDEALFCLGMRSYDVTNHHPHPPGFPVFIATAKLLRLIIPSDFRALQVINLGALKSGDRARVEYDIRGVAQIAHTNGALLKVIIETGLLSMDEKNLACELSVAAGADFR